jgi:hypothetical protein
MIEPPAATLESLEARVRARGAIDDTDVLALRRAIYAREQVDRGVAGTVLRLHRHVAQRGAAWDELYLDVLMDYFFWGRDDGVIDESDAAWLVAEMQADGRTDDRSELELLRRLVFRARGCPDALCRLAREATLASLRGGGTAPGAGAPPRIDRREVEAIRRLVYGLGGDDGPAIGAVEAEWLIELDHATASADHAPEWQDLFVKAVSMHVLHGGDSPDTVDGGEARWLRTRLERGHGLTPNGQALLVHLARECRFLDPGLEALLPRERPARDGPTFGRKRLPEPV